MNPKVSGAALCVEMNTRLLTNCLDGIDDEIACTRVGETNHLAFLGTHLVGARHYFANVIGRETTDPFEELTKDKKKLEDFDSFPSVDQIVPAYQAAGTELLAALEGLTDDALAGDPPFQFPIDDSTLFGAVTFLAAHESYHVGQMGLLRKYLGKGAMSYG